MRLSILGCGWKHYRCDWAYSTLKMLPGTLNLDSLPQPVLEFRVSPGWPMVLNSQHRAIAPCRILLAEDNPADALLLELAFRTQNLPVDIERYSAGEHLMARLRELSQAPDGRFKLAVLDANLQGISAEEVLSQLAAERIRIEIPVIVLSSYVHPSNRARLMALGVKHVLIKPMDFEPYLSLASELALLCDYSWASSA
jgi:CheY-like chemotaxis protein